MPRRHKLMKKRKSHGRIECKRRDFAEHVGGSHNVSEIRNIPPATISSSLESRTIRTIHGSTPVEAKAMTANTDISLSAKGSSSMPAA